MKNLDLKTVLFLYITGVVIEKEKKYTIKAVNRKSIYIFSNYDEFKNYFNNYISDVDEELINMAIYTRSKKGAVIAFKGLCDHIITKLKIKDSFLTQEQVDEIHSRGKITAFEKVSEWESFDLCVPGDAIGSAKDRCHYFEGDCHECLLEYASSAMEYDKIDFRLVNSIVDESANVLKKTKE